MLEQSAPDVLGIHASHCCQRHGCKYGYPACPVANGKLAQEYPCEQCDFDVEEQHSFGANGRIEALTDIRDYLEAQVARVRGLHSPKMVGDLRLCAGCETAVAQVYYSKCKTLAALDGS